MRTVVSIVRSCFKALSNVYFVNLVVGGRSPKIGGDALTILSEDAIKVYLVYMDQLKSLFTKFIHHNWDESRRVSLLADTWSALLSNTLLFKTIGQDMEGH